MLLLFILLLSFGFFRGIHEGMIMIQDYDYTMYKLEGIIGCEEFNGIRNHIWFKYYHRLVILQYLFLALIYRCFPHLFTFQIVGLIAFSMWEAFEIGYAYARGGKLLYVRGLQYYENVFGIILRGWWVIAIHYFRIWWVVFFLELPRLMEIWKLN